ncbi:O-antigen polymerase [Escherichia coli]|uniref:O-antigen polymerase n=1 Tax=Escherichia coli TaxID=562 RepID=UPI00324852F1
MSDSEFFSFIFTHWIGYMLLTFLCAFLCYKAIRKTTYGIINPAHYFFAFGSGTAYSVVIILYLYGYIDDYLAIMVLLNFIILVITWRFSFSLNIKPIAGLRNALFREVDSNYKFSFKIIFVMYVVLTAYYLLNVSFSSFGESRFEANKGLGVIVRILDVVRLLLSAMLAINIYKTKNKLNRAIIIFFAILVAVIASFVSGAKFSLLEHALVSIAAIYIYSGVSPRINLKFLAISLVSFSAMIAYVLYILTFTSESIGYTSSQYTDLPVIFELFLMRIIANGDAYYFSLPYDTINRIVVENPFIQLFGYIGGNGFVKTVFSYNYFDNDVGRLIWKQWYPWDDIARGPTSHFDLAGYVFFGFIGSLIMTSIIGFIIGRISKAKYKNSGCMLPFTSSFLAVFYIKSLQLLLSPPVGIAYVVDMSVFLVAFSFVLLCLRFARTQR